MSQSPAYAFVIEQAEDGSYWAYLPDLPGCTTTADSIEAIEPQLRVAVALYLSYHRERGLPLPEVHARVGTLSAA